MNLNQTSSKYKYFALAFAIPFSLVLMVMIIGGYEPFGDRSMLYSDMYHQYYPFFVNFRRALLSGENIQFNWSVGLGMDYLALIAYYLASPLNLLCVLVPESLTLEFFSLLVPTKLGLASMFFAIFLHQCFRRNDPSIALFGSFYGLCAWALGYQWNVMWLDTFALLPLMTLGTIWLLRHKRFGLYTITLTLSILSNYYIGFFICILDLLLQESEQVLCRFQPDRCFHCHCHWHDCHSGAACLCGPAEHPVQRQLLPHHLPAEHCQRTYRSGSDQSHG